MNDRELIQALRHCASDDEYGCLRCPGESMCDECTGKSLLDAADRLEALLALNEALNERDEASKELVQALERKNAALERNVQLLKDQIPKWRPVSEPPETIPCIAGTEYSEAVNVLTSGRKVLTAIYNGHEFITDADFWEAWDEEITHWAPVPMPLPSTEEVE